MDSASVFGTDSNNSQPASESRTYNKGMDCAGHSLCQNDADFGLLATVWPMLPKPVKAGIVAMVKAAKQTQTDED